jgi:ABC-type multidrug transport system ATPase subunit
METDDMVQKAIRKEFFNSTVVMIAHRLQTIIDCDKVLVMSLGKLIEFDHPYVLLKPYFEKIKLHVLLESNSDILIEKEVEKIKKYIPSNSFASMVIETGPVMSINLWKASITSWELKKTNKENKEI